MTYDATVQSTRNYIRLLIADTDTSNEIFSDAEIDMVIAKYGDYPYKCAGLLIMAVASSKARIAVAMSTGMKDFVVDRKAAAKELREQAKLFFEQAKECDSFVTEVYLEDEDITFIDSLGGSAEYDYDTLDSELNT